MSTLRSSDIHARVDWPAVLGQLGIADQFLRLKKPSPCPACGGRDRYIFDNRHGRGDFLCRGCGAGDGFELLKRVHGWTFAEARRQVMDAASLGTPPNMLPAQPRAPLGADISSIPQWGPLYTKGGGGAMLNRPTAVERHGPPSRVLAVARAACPVADCQDAVDYLAGRGLWPLPEGCALKAHPSIDYWHDGQRTRYPGLVAEVRDVDGAPVTVHVTYLQDGKKIPGEAPRKMLSPCTGHEGCAVRLFPATDVLGIAEGIETALSAAVLHKVPVWAALNTSLLAKFEPPAGVQLLHIFSDRDTAGLEAAGRLTQRLQGRVRFEMHLPAAPHKDFNDQLAAKSAKEINP